MPGKYNIDELRRLQKNARNKEYRLRRRGGSGADVAAESPRVTWGEVLSMTQGERQRYANALRSYNSRENRYVILPSGQPVEKALMDRIDDLTAKWNSNAAKERRRIEKLARTEVSESKRKRARLRGSVFGSISELENIEPPRNRAAAEKRARDLERMVGLKFSRRRTMQRNNMVNIMNQLGLTSLANQVHNMTNNQFDVLQMSTNIWDVLSLYYIPKEADERHRTQIMNEERSSNIYYEVYKAKTYDIVDDAERRQMINDLAKKDEKKQGFGDSWIGRIAKAVVMRRA